MGSRVARFSFTVLLVALGLAASGALLVDYTTASPIFCSEGGGCDALRQTGIAHPLGLPLPLLGLAGLGVLALLTITRGKVVRGANLVASGLGGVFGLALLVLQAVFGHFCPYCAVVDVSVVTLSVLAVRRMRTEEDPPPGFLPAVASAFVLAAGFAAPVVWARHEARKVPDVIVNELRQTPPGMVTIVDFVDFECPFCREMQGRLAPHLAAEAGKIHLVRKMVPLSRIHPHALDAARAACCGDALGKGDAMADALFEAKVEDLTPEGCAHVAESLGLPMDKYKACLTSPETDARLAKDRQEFDHAARRGDGLPLMWVGPFKLMGAQDDETLSQAIGQALAGTGS